MGYKKMRLDTVPAMQTAQKLYESIGFKDIPPYTINPIDGARYMELDFKKAKGIRMEHITINLL